MLRDINARFTRPDGASCNDHSLEGCGVLLHQFDAMEDPQRPWRPCPEVNSRGEISQCAFLRDRMSAASISAGEDPKYRQSHIQLFAGGTGGVLLRPSATKVLCGYAGDGGTRGKVCAQIGMMNCIPGCIATEWDTWCSADESKAVDGWCDGRPWKVAELGTMLRRHASRMSSYNEIVVDSRAWIDRLPSSIEAFFFPGGSKCDFDSSCQQTVRAAHDTFLREYFPSLTKYDVPLLRLNVTDWESPFSIAQ